MKNSRPTSRELRQFEAALHQAQTESVQVTDSLLTRLAAKRDAYLESLR